MALARRLPVYYIGHGSPTLVIDTHDPTHHFLKNLGKTICNEIKPKAIVIVSAHWQTTEFVKVGSFQGETPLIYDFYGFSDIMYKQKYQSKGSPELASKIVKMLNEAKIDAALASDRGLDHGAWVPLKVAIPNPGETPIIQVSLKHSATFDHHLKVGRALAPLRDEEVLIIGSGSLVHNLREFFTNIGGLPTPYAEKFDKDVSDMIDQYKGDELREKLKGLKDHPLLKQAHPTYEHLVPLHVIAGAADNDSGKKVHHEIASSLSSSAFVWGDEKMIPTARVEL